MIYRRAGILLVLSLAVFLGSCFTPRAAMDVPDGFSPYREGDDLTMVSPEGTRLRARVIDNDPPQTLEFWRTALAEHMVNGGYTLVDEGTIGRDAAWFEWLAPVNGEDWIYLNAVRISDDAIVLVESAARVELYRRRRDAIRNALDTVTVR